MNPHPLDAYKMMKDKGNQQKDMQSNPHTDKISLFSHRKHQENDNIHTNISLIDKNTNFLNSNLNFGAMNIPTKIYPKFRQQTFKEILKNDDAPIKKLSSNNANNASHHVIDFIDSSVNNIIPSPQQPPAKKILTNEEKIAMLKEKISSKNHNNSGLHSTGDHNSKIQSVQCSRNFL